MYNTTSLWYTDIFNIYRNIKTIKSGITKTSRKLISENNIGRIYRKSNASINSNIQASELQITESLICNIDIDIEAGDEIRVIRGYKINKNKTKVDIYIAGQPVDYYTPYGGVSPDVAHKQVSLTNTLRTGAYYATKETD